jgi:sarcosine oxidase delta subunit
MKHTLFPPLPITQPNPAPMSDRDWEEYVLRRANEEADFFNASAYLSEKPNVQP